MTDKLKEIKETLQDIESLDNADNSLMISASTYTEHVKYLLELFGDKVSQKEILKELEKVSERMVRGWESQWTLKEIHQMILKIK